MLQLIITLILQVLLMSNTSQLQEIKSSIDKVYADKPVLAQLCLAQAVLESRLLGEPSKLASLYKNLFGIKGNPTKQNVVVLPTYECNSKGCYKTKEPFAAYDNYDASIEHHRQLMQKPRYKKVWEAQSLEEAAKEVKAAGYATDGAYSKKLIKAYKEVMEVLK